MTTQKNVLRSIDETITNYVPTYRAIYPLFLPRGRQYQAEVGKINYKQIDAMGDIRAKHYTPKDTEMQTISTGESAKLFHKYFMANKYTVSTLQDLNEIQRIQTQVLEEHQKQADEFLFMGDPVNGTQTNNSLYLSNDTNYIVNGSEEVDVNANQNKLHELVVSVAEEANNIAGRKLLFHYGTELNKVWNSLWTSGPKPFKSLLQEVLGPDYVQIQLPSSLVPNTAQGFKIVNLDHTILNYTLVPTIDDQGTNLEMKYHWFNFIFGSMMVDVETKGAIIRQPVTLAAEGG